MEEMENCPKCQSTYTYFDGVINVCPECTYEWIPGTTQSQEPVIKDSNGTILEDGDSVIVIKDLKVKGSSSSIKIGTKVKNIRLLYEARDDHDIECKIDGFGAMKLKSSVVKKN
ncbi:zinc ribbon domain-containing protein YjdM [Tannockella kyphosi]|uniref:zinc ribbon domain-containing protein YjdM n=1 Tax=Tannockella kyphosi TaxID=2899121 RepID=UPI00201154AC|nr:zinc ribbon domain-containing protein YjdM [Tannockella kyphosi]